MFFTRQTALTLFSGFGLVDIGLKLAGFRVVGAVEKSEKFAKIYNLNHPDSELMIGSVEEFDYQKFSGIDLIHLSPPCQQYSQARNRDLARRSDADAVTLAQKAIAQIFPKFITLENVRGYIKAPSYIQFKQFLWNLGYWVNEEILNCADYGVPQSRIRLFTRWVRNDILPNLPYDYIEPTLFEEKYWYGLLPQKQPAKGWYSAIADLIPSLPKTSLAPWQIKRLRQIKERLPEEIKSHILISGQNNHGTICRDSNPAYTVCGKTLPCALLIRRVGQRKKDQIDIFKPEQPSPTIKALGHKNQWRQLDGWDGHKIVKITPRCLARFQTVPDSFKLPTSASLACQGIGNGVPCEMMRQIATNLITTTNNYDSTT